MTSSRPITACLLLAALSLGAQTGTVTPNELDNRYRPNETSPFSHTTRKVGEPIDYEVSNAIKYCPSMLFRQKVMFFYELKLVDGLAINLGLGKAFGNDPIQSAFYTIWDPETEQNKLSPVDIFTFGKYYSSGPLLYAGARVYFSGDAFEGGFIEFNYRRERMSYQIPPNIGGSRVEGNTIVDFRMSNFNFGFGITNITGKNSHGVHEFVMTVGIKNFLYTQYDRVDNSGVSGQAGDMVYRRTSRESDARIAPSVHLTYCFGFGW